MLQHKIVSQSEWTGSAQGVSRQGEGIHAGTRPLSAERRKLPWVKVDKAYVFDTPDGKKTLAELFDGKSQLVVYHFMLGPGWEEGCPSCSYLADHFDGAIAHCRSATWRSSWSRARRSPRSKPSSSAWAGVSNGSPRSAATSTSTTTCRFQRGRGRHRGRVQLRKEEIGSDEMPGVERVLQRRERHRLSHLFRLRAGARHPGRRL